MTTALTIATVAILAFVLGVGCGIILVRWVVELGPGNATYDTMKAIIDDLERRA